MMDTNDNIRGNSADTNFWEQPETSSIMGDTMEKNKETLLDT